MPRFLKGTTDHDSDGKMGGSLPATEETDMAKEPVKPETPAKAPEKPATGDKASDRLEALEAEVKKLTARVKKLEGSNGEVRDVLSARLQSRGIEV